MRQDLSRVFLRGRGLELSDGVFQEIDFGFSKLILLHTLLAPLNSGDPAQDSRASKLDTKSVVTAFGLHFRSSS